MPDLVQGLTILKVSSSSIILYSKKKHNALDALVCNLTYPLFCKYLCSVFFALVCSNRIKKGTGVYEPIPATLGSLTVKGERAVATQRERGHQSVKREME